MSTTRTSAEVQADLDAAKAKAATLATEIAALKRDLAAKEKARTDLIGAAWDSRDGGTIGRLASELAEAQRTEADAALPRVRVSNYYGETWREYVLVSVGKKRTTLRLAGSERAEHWPTGAVEHHGRRLHPEDAARLGWGGPVVVVPGEGAGQ